MNIVLSIILFPLIVTSLVSCIVSEGPVGAVYPVAPTVSFGVYDTIPNAYVGNAYYYQDRYYYGGNYQRGRYSYLGRQYDDRYYHGGKYYYGGNHRHYRNQGRDHSNHTQNRERQPSSNRRRIDSHRDSREHKQR